MKTRKLDAIMNVLTMGVLGLAAVVGGRALLSSNGPAETPPGPELAPKERPRIKGWEAIAAKGHLTGSPSAPVLITEFSDFQCPFCARLQVVLQDVRERYAGRVAFVFRHWPLPIHPQAFAAAQASECAGEQERFDRYRELLFAKPASVQEGDWYGLALDAEVPDTASFRVCMGEERHNDRINRDASEAMRLGSGTPVVLVNDRLLVGAPTTDQMEELIQFVLRENLGK